MKKIEIEVKFLIGDKAYYVLTPICGEATVEEVVITDVDITVYSVANTIDDIATYHFKTKGYGESRSPGSWLFETLEEAQYEANRINEAASRERIKKQGKAK